MRVADQTLLVLSSLARHPLRTTLTLLGMIIGVASVILMTSLGLGARAQVQADIARLGTHLLTVSVYRERGGSAEPGAVAGQLRLTDADARALKSEIAGVRYAVPVVSGRVQLVADGATWQTTVIGTHPDYLPIRDWETVAGRNLSPHDVASAAKVVLLGRTVEERLSPLQPLLGRIIRINDVPFRVIGLLGGKGQAMNGQDQDDLIVAPVSAVRSRLVGGAVRDSRNTAAYLLLKAASGDELEAIGDAAASLLRKRHRTSAERGMDFNVREPAATLAASRTASETLTLFLGCVAAVSMLVGGISITNIMLVSVAERTREIGIRIAVGATRGDIRRQFLAESAGVALLGGVIGAVVGVLSSFLANAALGWSALVSGWICLGVLTFSVLVGAAAGLYPAHRAAALDPMDAIRQV